MASADRPGGYAAGAGLNGRVPRNGHDTGHDTRPDVRKDGHHISKADIDGLHQDLARSRAAGHNGAPGGHQANRLLERLINLVRDARRSSKVTEP